MKSLVRFAVLVLVLASGCMQAELTQEDAQSFANVLEGGTSSGLSSATGVVAYVPQGFSSTAACSAGGRMGVFGDFSGSIDNTTGNGVIFTQITATFTDCDEGDVVFNGDPYVSATGSMSFSSGQMTSGSVTFRGGFRWDETGGSGSCQVDLSLVLQSATSKYSHLSGTVCGYQVEVYR